MKTLLISGAQDTGKTEALQRLVTPHLIPFVVESSVRPIPEFPVPPPPPRRPRDFRALFDINGIRVIISTSSDDLKAVKTARAFFDKHNNVKPIDILITSIRAEPDPVRTTLLTAFGLNVASADVVEIPLGKVTRRGSRRPLARTGMQNAIDRLIVHVLSNAPFNLPI